MKELVRAYSFRREVLTAWGSIRVAQVVCSRLLDGGVRTINVESAEKKREVSSCFFSAPSIFRFLHHCLNAWNRLLLKAMAESNVCFFMEHGHASIKAHACTIALHLGSNHVM